MNAQGGKQLPSPEADSNRRRSASATPGARKRHAAVKATAEQSTLVVVSARGAARIRAGHPWVYRSDVFAGTGVAPGSLVTVQDQSGRLLGTALYSSVSQIAIRMVSTAVLPAAQFPAVLRERIGAAIEFRSRIVAESDAYRLVFSEADFLPGLIVDRYNDLLSMQVLTQAMDTPSFRDTIVQELVARLQPAAVIERVEPRIRQLEHLPPRETDLLYGNKCGTIFTMNGVRFQYDARSGQKTGAYLDQRENYAAAARYARGEALDVFCYQGGFALHLAAVCGHVTGVDSSQQALQVAEQNAALNCREIEWIEANAFDLLRDYAAAGRRYDTIILDPPAFAKNQRARETALRGYKELNLRALKMLRPQGLLVTCSCSYHVSAEEFLQVLSAASLDAHRQLRLLESRTQAKDHPILLTVPETRYLKCFIAAVE
jgi:23S rRNA (cytosine1962-C5)-methyltransferase